MLPLKSEWGGCACLGEMALVGAGSGCVSQNTVGIVFMEIDFFSPPYLPRGGCVYLSVWVCISLRGNLKEGRLT